MMGHYHPSITLNIPKVAEKSIIQHKVVFERVQNVHASHRTQRAARSVQILQIKHLQSTYQEVVSLNCNPNFEVHGMLGKLIRTGLVGLIAFGLVWFAVANEKQARLADLDEGVKSDIIGRLAAGKRNTTIAATKLGNSGRYFFQVSSMDEDGLSQAYGWVYPDRCRASQECITVEKQHGIAIAARTSTLGTSPDIRVERTERSAELKTTKEITTALNQETSNLESNRSTLTNSGANEGTSSGNAIVSDSAVIARPIASEEQKFQVSASRVNVRSGPGADNDIVGVITPSTTFSIVERSNRWARISTDRDGGEVLGWIWSDLIDTPEE